MAHRAYPTAQRADAVRLVTDGASPAQVARDIGVGRGTVQRWVAEASEPDQPGTAPATPVRVPSLAPFDQEAARTLIAQLTRRLDLLELRLGLPQQASESVTLTS